MKFLTGNLVSHVSTRYLPIKAPWDRATMLNSVLAKNSLDFACNLCDYRVTGLMPVLVIDRFESVDVSRAHANDVVVVVAAQDLPMCGPLKPPSVHQAG